MSRLALISAALVSAVAVPSFAAISSTQTDGASPVTYMNGGGTGFGGTLGNGSLSFDATATDLVIGFTPGGTLDNNVALFLDTRTGGFVDADMRDRADGGRRALSEISLDGNDLYPAGFLPDFGVVFGNFGTVVFELNAGTTDGHLAFVSFTPTVGSTSIPLATLGGPANVDFFAAYTSDSAFSSNESLPATTAGVNQGINPGFGDANTINTYDNFNRFVVAVPEPTTLGLLAGVAAVALRRRK